MTAGDVHRRSWRHSDSFPARPRGIVRFGHVSATRRWTDTVISLGGRMAGRAAGHGRANQVPPEFSVGRRPAFRHQRPDGPGASPGGDPAANARPLTLVTGAGRGWR
jgi:hypothetical protein